MKCSRCGCQNLNCNDLAEKVKKLSSKVKALKAEIKELKKISDTCLICGCIEFLCGHNKKG